jgi:hypothetical protein
VVRIRSRFTAPRLRHAGSPGKRTLAPRKEASARTFEAITEACIKAQSPGWKNLRTPAIWRATFQRHVYPTLGNMPVANVDRAAVLRALDGVWTTRRRAGCN